MGKKKNNLVNKIRKLARQEQLEREKVVGKPRSNLFGGRPTPKEERRVVKKDLRKLDDE
jgi:hypothetical protein